jgi:hypothetical protein
LFVYDIYIKSRETNPWVEKVKNLLNGLGHSYIINNINSIKLNLNTIKQRIHDQCLQTQNDLPIINQSPSFNAAS